MLPVSINIGILIGFIFSGLLEFEEIPWGAMVCLGLFLCTFTIFPDTPRQLYKIGHHQKAIESLQIYRDIRDLERQTDDCYIVEVRKIRKALKQDDGFRTHFGNQLNEPNTRHRLICYSIFQTQRVHTNSSL